MLEELEDADDVREDELMELELLEDELRDDDDALLTGELELLDMLLTEELDEDGLDETLELLDVLELEEFDEVELTLEEDDEELDDELDELCAKAGSAVRRMVAVAHKDATFFMEKEGKDNRSIRWGFHEWNRIVEIFPFHSIDKENRLVVTKIVVLSIITSMQVRFSLSVGLKVVSEESSEAIGEIAGILIHPDKAKVEGFFVAVQKGILSQDELFLSSYDVVRWTTHVFVKRDDVLSPLEDMIRLQNLFEEGRSVINQAIRTESGQFLGYCKDVQFETTHFLVDWIFPRKFLKWGIALPVSEILEVKPDGIIVKDQAKTVEDEEPVKEADVAKPLVAPVPEAA